jgi:hypothetical protein
VVIELKLWHLTILKNGYKTIDPIEKCIGWILRHHTLNVGCYLKNGRKN